MLLSHHERLIVRRYLAPRAGERVIVLVASISLLAVTLGVAALVVITSVMNGFHAYMVERVVEATGHGVVRGRDGLLPRWREVVAEARRTPGVTAAVPLIEQRLMASSSGRVSAASVRAMPAGDIARGTLRPRVVAGSLDLRPGAGEVAIGARMAEILGVSVGRRIELLNVGLREGELDVKAISYEVVGIVETEVADFDASAVLMPLQDAQALLGWGDAVTSVAIETEDVDRADAILAPLGPRVARYGELRSWKTLNQAMISALAVDAAGMVVVLSIIILVATFNILSALVMLVRAKTRDIAIQRTMGANRRAVLRIFIAVGMAIGVTGTAAGLALGLVFVWFRTGIGTFIQRVMGTTTVAGAEFLVELPARVDWMEILVIGLASLLLSFLATLYPALKAARTDPARILASI
ncbi:MAG TPA: ABC transporter permease [Allosphingosinicella sp.]